MLRIFALVLTMLLCGGLARSTEGTWTAPSVFFSLVWGFYVLSATYFFVDPQQMIGGILWITLGCGAVYLGTLFGHLNPAVHGATPSDAPEAPNLSLLRPVLVTTVVIGLVQILFLFARQGYSVRSVLSFAAIGQLTAANRGEFIYGDQQQTLAEQLGFLCLYFGALGGGAFFKLATTRCERVLAALNLLMPTIVMALYGSRMGVLYGGSFWVSSYISVHVLKGRSKASSDVRFLLRIGALAVSVLLGLQLAVQMLRYSTESHEVPLYRMIADPFGFLAAFGIWFDKAGWQFSQFTLGARAFRRVVAIVGIAKPPLPSIDVGFTSSNIYTVLRDLIEDFGSVGALIFLFVYGFVARSAFARVRSGDARWVGALTLIFAFALTSFSVSIFFYTATMLAALGFVLYCWGFASLMRRYAHRDQHIRHHEPAIVLPPK
ncbi:MAG TPA: O-antigen polymerase [Acidobacteriaceae bacterium]|nr:O-antigen polymerase [Acidobacteriaceae bacterium]